MELYFPKMTRTKFAYLRVSFLDLQTHRWFRSKFIIVWSLHAFICQPILCFSFLNKWMSFLNMCPCLFLTSTFFFFFFSDCHIWSSSRVLCNKSDWACVSDPAWGGRVERVERVRSWAGWEEFFAVKMLSRMLPVQIFRASKSQCESECLERERESERGRETQGWFVIVPSSLVPDLSLTVSW